MIRLLRFYPVLALLTVLHVDLLFTCVKIRAHQSRPTDETYFLRARIHPD